MHSLSQAIVLYGILLLAALSPIVMLARYIRWIE